MKKLFLAAIVILTAASNLKAQNDSTFSPTDSHRLMPPENQIEINLLALPIKNFSIDYQRKISRKTSLGLNVRLMPEGLIPFAGSIKSSISDSTTKSQIDNFKVGNFAIMPEIRFYLGRKGAFHGFYIAPFVSYAHYSASLPYTYTDNNVDKTLQMSGSVNCFTGGLLFGAQWNLGKRLFIDLHFIGPNYGGCNGSISGKGSLSSDEQSALKMSLDDLSVPLVKTSNSVDANGAKLNFSGPWAGVRSGLCIGVKF